MNQGLATKALGLGHIAARECGLSTAGGFVELNRAANVQREVQRGFRSREVAEPHQNLSHRRQRHREAVARPVRFM